MPFSVRKLSISAAVALTIVFTIVLHMKTSYIIRRSSAPTSQVLIETPTSAPTIEELCKGDEKKINCVDILLERLVIATGVSSNHYQEAMSGMIGSVQRMMPKTKIIVYDLGLTVEQRDNASRICGVEMRTFNFSKYPDHVSPKTLLEFAWKPLIAAELGKEYEVIMWGDSSVRLLEPLQNHVLPYFLDVDLPLVGTSVNIDIVPMTHNKTMEYLNVTRESMRGLQTIQGGCWAMWLTENTKRILNSWEDCAMHKECIAPEGATLGGCNLGFARQDVNYCGCHRYDQSALDVILFREFGKEVWKSALQDGGYYWRETFVVHRTTKQEYPIAYCT